MMKRQIPILIILISAIMFSCGPAEYKPGTPIKMKSLTGKEYTIGVETEKPVFMAFFATWCPGCKMMMPAFDSIASTLDHSKIDVLLIGREHTEDELKSWSDTLSLNCEIIPDPNRDIYSNFADKQIPRIYVLDKTGAIHFQTVGWGGPKTEVLIQALNDVLQ